MQTKYAIYYNKSYDHSGAVFMKPFKSKPIYTKGQFFSLLSYVLNNPVKAGIACFYNEYKWNSPLFGYEKYNITDYLYVNKFYKPIAGLSLNDYIIKRSNSYKIAEIEKESFSIEEAEKEFFKITDTFSKHKHFSINQIPLSVKKKIISKALYIGISSRQIAKITGLSKSSICQMKMKKSYL
jgi:hypothetical protein